MREFAQEAKRHGLLFVPMRDRNDPDHIEIATWADDSAKVERIIDRMQLDVVETGEGEIMSEVTPEQNIPRQKEAEPDNPATQTADSPSPFELDDADYDLGFTQPAPSPAEPEIPLPTRSTRTNAPQSEKPLTPSAVSRSRSPTTSPTLHAGEVRARVSAPACGMNCGRSKPCCASGNLSLHAPKRRSAFIAADRRGEPEVFCLFSIGR